MIIPPPLQKHAPMFIALLFNPTPSPQTSLPRQQWKSLEPFSRGITELCVVPPSKLMHGLRLAL